MRDLRTERQKDDDKKRRLATQCIFVGWFPVREGETPTNPGSDQVYRRCNRSMDAEHNPWCHNHWRREDDDPNEDPGLKKKKRNTKGGGKGPKSKKKDDEDDNDAPDDSGKKKKKSSRGLGMPGWVHSLLGTGEKVQ